VVAVIWLAPMVIVVLGLALVLGRYATPPRVRTFRASVDLYAIRRRFAVAHYKFAVRREAADARRELRGELRRLNERRRP
jgi:hypothetical protein